MTEWISTKEAKQMLGVSASTIKRWSLESRLPYMRTAGGHRRFERSVVESFLKESHSPRRADASSVAKWVEWLRHRDVGFVRGKISGLIDDCEDCFAAADFLFKVATDIGERWATGDFSTTDVQIATEKLSQAIVARSVDFDTRDDAHLCTLASLSGDHQRIGLDLAQLCLRSLRVNAQWIGVDTPVAQLVLHLRSADERGKMLVLSASNWQSDSIALRAAYRDIASTCAEQNLELILSGEGQWPDDIDYGRRCCAFSDLKLAVEMII